jgi:hypothetical protein
MRSNSLDDVVISELLQLHAAELRLTSMYNTLRSTPEPNRETGRFLALLADLDHRACKVEALLEEIPTALASPQRLVA